MVPLKNRCGLIEATLQSIVAQTVPQWEAVVVDDGSTDGSDRVVQAMSDGDSRIRLERREGDIGGAPACRNQGVQAARGEFILFLDSDDLLGPHCLEHRMAVLEANRGLDFAVFGAKVFVNAMGDTDITSYDLFSPGDDLDRFLTSDFPWNTPGPLWRRSAVKRVGPWDVRLRAWQDWDYHTRAIALGLKYEKFDQCDVWICRGDQERIGSRVTPERCVSIAQMVGRTADMLRDADLLTPVRTRLLAGLVLNNLLHCLCCGGAPADLRAIWEAARQHELMSCFAGFELSALLPVLGRIGGR